MSANTVICAGNLVRNPKTFPRKDESGIVTRFTIAINRPSGKTDYIDCVAFAENAIKLNDHAEKGTAIQLSGSLRSRSYERNGATAYTTEVHVQLLDIFSRARAIAPAPAASRERRAKAAA